jgi:hypothetical protein
MSVYAPNYLFSRGQAAGLLPHDSLNGRRSTCCVHGAERKALSNLSALKPRPPGTTPTASRARCILSRVTRRPSGWNVDRHERDAGDQDRIKRDFRDVETPTSPHLYSLLVHVRPPSIVNRPTPLSLEKWWSPPRVTFRELPQSNKSCGMLVLIFVMEHTDALR